MDTPKYQTACRKIDDANADDPRRVDGEPHEVIYSRRRVEWVAKLAPGASEELRLAARAQHIRRWTVPRNDYPEGRAGYLRWREGLKKVHADLACSILGEAGYGDAEVARARTILLRKNFADDPEGQTLEDAACLVFLQHELVPFVEKTEPDKVVDILRKTWGKMSSAAHQAALSLDYAPREKALLDRALA